MFDANWPNFFFFVIKDLKTTKDKEVVEETEKGKKDKANGKAVSAMLVDIYAFVRVPLEPISSKHLS